jgi:hypothetical protein
MPSITLPGAILGAGALGIGGTIGSSLIGANAAENAANAQLQAANLATNTQLGIFNQTQANLAPYNTMGQSALSQLAALFGLGPGGTGPNAGTAAAATSALQNYPGYQFAFGQGLNALDASAASQGLLLSGNQLTAAQQYGQNYALQNAWNPYVSQLSSLAGLGENAAAQTGTIGANTGSNVAQTQLAAGQAAASGITGAANAITGGLTTGINTGLNSALLALALGNNSSLNSPANAAAYNFGTSGVPYATSQLPFGAAYGQ